MWAAKINQGLPLTFFLTSQEKNGKSWKMLHLKSHIPHPTQGLSKTSNHEKPQTPILISSINHSNFKNSHSAWLLSPLTLVKPGCDSRVFCKLTLPAWRKTQNCLFPKAPHFVSFKRRLLPAE